MPAMVIRNETKYTVRRSSIRDHHRSRDGRWKRCNDGSRCEFESWSDTVCVSWLKFSARTKKIGDSVATDFLPTYIVFLILPPPFTVIVYCCINMKTLQASALLSMLTAASSLTSRSQLHRKHIRNLHAKDPRREQGELRFCSGQWL